MINKPFQSILKKIKKFRDERDWQQFHNPKDMAEAIVIEAGELLEKFLWKSQKDSKQHAKNKKNLEEIADELADVLYFSIELVDDLGLDIETIISKKIQKNARKYPVNKAKGVAIKYTKL
jgi:NTP pyrophosphatase (non-canonical NTP hydrolase)